MHVHTISVQTLAVSVGRATNKWLTVHQFDTC